MCIQLATCPDSSRKGERLTYSWYVGCVCTGLFRLSGRHSYVRAQFCTGFSNKQVGADFNVVFFGVFFLIYIQLQSAFAIRTHRSSHTFFFVFIWRFEPNRTKEKLSKTMECPCILQLLSSQAAISEWTT